MNIGRLHGHGCYPWPRLHTEQEGMTVKFFKLAALGLGLAALTISSGGATIASAQDALPAPSNVNVSNGDSSGEVVVSWTAVADAQYYRIG